MLNDRRIKLTSECGISNIVHEYLSMQKVSARWVPRNLDMQDRQQWLESNQELLEVYNANPEDFHTRLVTGDETWLHHLDPYIKTSTCNVCTLAQPTLEISYPTKWLRCFGTPKDYIDRLQACWYFNYRRVLRQGHLTIKDLY